MDIVQLRSYELTYLVPGTMTDNDVAQVRNEIEQLLKKYSAKLEKNEDWGRKQLAYVMKHEGKKHSEGIYTHLVFSLDPSKAPDLERDVYLSNRVMRHLLLIAEDGGEEVINQ